MARYTWMMTLALMACTGNDDTGETGDTNAIDTCLPENDQDGDGVCVPEDCDDTNLNVYPGAYEIPYNNRDDNCDGEDLWDVDNDGYNGGPDGEDCSDNDPSIYPGAYEPCYPDFDYNCDGIVSPDDCDLDGWVRSEDCDDENDTTYPGAPDPWYDGVDSSCKNVSDFDADADGDDLEWQSDWPDAAWPDRIPAWDPANPGKVKYFELDDVTEESWYDHGQDCDDDQPLVGGRLDELWDGVDRNCDGVVDALHQNDGFKTWNGNGGAGGIGGALAGDAAFGTSMAYLGDLDGDGYPEIASGDLVANDYLGRVYVISTGASSGKAYEQALSSIDDPDATGAVLGWAMDAAGDLNGDGKSELLVGAPVHGGVGAVLVFDAEDLISGTALKVSDRLAELAVGEYTGMAVAGAGDLTGDSVPDILAGTHNWRSLAVGVFSGSDVGEGGSFGVGDSEGLISDGDRFGGDLVGGLDMDGDGELEIAINSQGDTTSDVGYTCTSTSEIFVANSSDVTGSVIVSPDDLLTLTGSGCSGFTMGMINDMDGDGYAELVVADPGHDATDSDTLGGMIYIVDGNDFVDGQDLADIASVTVQSHIGDTWLRVQHHAGDHDNDGFPDLLVGAPSIADVYMEAQTVIPAGTENDLYWFPATTFTGGGAFDTTQASADFYHQTGGSAMGSAWAVGPMDTTDAIDDVAVSAARQGAGGLFVFLSQM